MIRHTISDFFLFCLVYFANVVKANSSSSSSSSSSANTQLHNIPPLVSSGSLSIQHQDGFEGEKQLSNGTSILSRGVDTAECEDIFDSVITNNNDGEKYDASMDTNNIINNSNGRNETHHNMLSITPSSVTSILENLMMKPTNNKQLLLLQNIRPSIRPTAETKVVVVTTQRRLQNNNQPSTMSVPIPVEVATSTTKTTTTTTTAAAASSVSSGTTSMIRSRTTVIRAESRKRTIIPPQIQQQQKQQREKDHKAKNNQYKNDTTQRKNKIVTKNSSSKNEPSHSLRRLKREWRDAVELGVAYDWHRMETIQRRRKRNKQEEKNSLQQKQQHQQIHQTSSSTMTTTFSTTTGKRSTTTIVSTSSSSSRNIPTAPPSHLRLGPINGNLLQWHFSILGPDGSEYQNGIYHGRVLLPKNYPMVPPRVQLLTPSGRFIPYHDICLSASSYHPETWTPQWTVLSLVEALRLHMLTQANEIGGMNSSKDVRRRYAVQSRHWKYQPKMKMKYNNKKKKERGAGGTGTMLIIDHSKLIHVLYSPNSQPTTLLTEVEVDRNNLIEDRNHDNNDTKDDIIENEVKQKENIPTQHVKKRIKKNKKKLDETIDTDINTLSPKTKRKRRKKNQQQQHKTKKSISSSAISQRQLVEFDASTAIVASANDENNRNTLLHPKVHDNGITKKKLIRNPLVDFVTSPMVKLLISICIFYFLISSPQTSFSITFII